jgi:hypothetical protein
MGYAKNKQGKLVPTSIAQAKIEKREYSCGVAAGRRAWQEQNHDLKKRAWVSNDPWERGFKRGWVEAKSTKVD